MERVVRAVGTLLLVAVVVLSVMTYAGIYNISNTLDYIKTGISKLVTWFIPERFDVDVSLAVNGTYDGKTIKVIESVPANTVIAYVNVSLKGAPVEIVIDASTYNLEVNLVDAVNATVMPYPAIDIIPMKLEVHSSGNGFVTIAIRSTSDIPASVDSPLEIYLYYKRI